MMYRLNIFWKMVKINDNLILICIWNKKIRLSHKDKKVIYNLDYCYRKLLIKDSLNLSNKQLWNELIFFLEKIWFFIKISDNNYNSSIDELNLINELFSNPLSNYSKITLNDEVSILKEKNNIKNINNYKKFEKVWDNFIDYLMTRKSIRNFNKNLTENNIIWMMTAWFHLHTIKDNWYIVNWNNPSAGGFYEINGYFILFKDIENYKKWLYFYEKSDCSIKKIKESIISDYFIKDSLKNFSEINWILLFVWDLEYISKKYGYRSYLYQSIEVWVIIENILLYNLKSNIWSCVFWWFIHDKLIKYIGLGKNNIIYSSLFF